MTYEKTRFIVAHNLIGKPYEESCITYYRIVKVESFSGIISN